MIPTVYHLKCDFFSDKLAILYLPLRKYVNQMIDEYSTIFRSNLRQAYHPTRDGGGGHSDLNDS